MHEKTSTTPTPFPHGQPSPGGRFARFRVHQGREILALALPTVLTMLSQTLMWTVDTALLGRISSLAQAAASIGGLYAWTGYALFNNLSRITGTFVAQAEGRQEPREVGRYTWQGLWIATVAGLALMLAGYFSHHLLPLTKHAAEMQDLTYVYIKWRTLSAVGTQVTFCLMGYFQGRRQVRIPMWAGIVANGLNVVLDLWLIFGWSGVTVLGRQWLAVPPMGVLGAAIATSVGSLANMLILLAWAVLQRDGRRRYRIHLPAAPDWRRLWNMVRVGAPASLENFVDMSAFSLFSTYIARAGDVPGAANQIVIQLLAFSFMPMWGITTAGATLTGNWIGAGNPDRAAHYARQVFKVGIYYALGIGLVLVLLRGYLFRIFSVDPGVLALGATLTIIAACFQVCDGLRMVSIGILTGAGDTRFPMYQSMLMLWGVFVPMTWWVVIHQGGDVGDAWVTGTGCYLLQALFLWLRFRSGAWRRVRIFDDG